MEEGKEMLRSFGDLLQSHQKKKEEKNPPAPPADAAPESPKGVADGAVEKSQEPRVESQQPE
jgi:hypothetical protein